MGFVCSFRDGYGLSRLKDISISPGMRLTCHCSRDLSSMYVSVAFQKASMDMLCMNRNGRLHDYPLIFIGISENQMKQLNRTAAESLLNDADFTRMYEICEYYEASAHDSIPAPMPPSYKPTEPEEQRELKRDDECTSSCDALTDDTTTDENEQFTSSNNPPLNKFISSTSIIKTTAGKSPMNTILSSQKAGKIGPSKNCRQSQRLRKSNIKTVQKSPLLSQKASATSNKPYSNVAREYKRQNNDRELNPAASTSSTSNCQTLSSSSSSSLTVDRRILLHTLGNPTDVLLKKTIAYNENLLEKNEKAAAKRGKWSKSGIVEKMKKGATTITLFETKIKTNERWEPPGVELISVPNENKNQLECKCCCLVFRSYKFAHIHRKTVCGEVPMVVHGFNFAEDSLVTVDDELVPYTRIRFQLSLSLDPNSYKSLKGARILHRRTKKDGSKLWKKAIILSVVFKSVGDTFVSPDIKVSYVDSTTVNEETSIFKLLEEFPQNVRVIARSAQ